MSNGIGLGQKRDGLLSSGYRSAEGESPSKLWEVLISLFNWKYLM